MKQTILILLAAFVLFSFREEKKYKVELSLAQWQAVLSVLDNSSAPHNDVKTVSAWIVQQVQPQLKDTTIKK